MPAVFVADEGPRGGADARQGVQHAMLFDANERVVNGNKTIFSTSMSGSASRWGERRQRRLATSAVINGGGGDRIRERVVRQFRVGVLRFTRLSIGCASAGSGAARVGGPHGVGVGGGGLVPARVGRPLDVVQPGVCSHQSDSNPVTDSVGQPTDKSSDRSS